VATSRQLLLTRRRNQGRGWYLARIGRRLAVRHQDSGSIGSRLRTILSY
jgi:hypothetical protein